jgi:hypothetical protein
MRVPRDPDDDYTDVAAKQRRELVRERTGANLDHVGRWAATLARSSLLNGGSR